MEDNPAMTDTAAEQVSRVTDPPTSRQKDPKKVAAGRAGAAARKAKQDSLLEELRVVKESQRKTGSAPPADEVVAPPAAKGKDPAAGATTIWIAAAAVGLGLAYWTAGAPPVPKKSVTPPAVDQPAQQLKVRRDPFDME